MIEAKIIPLIISYFNAYGYYLIFFLLLAENSFLLGLIVPGEMVLVFASFLAGRGDLDLHRVVTVATVAALIGNNFGYILGREGGRRFMEKLGSRWIPPEKITAAEEYFDRHGQKTIIIGRFVAGVRTFVPVLAGAAKMPYLNFMAYTTIAVVAWTVSVGLLGYYFGENWELLLTIIKRAELAIGVIAVLVVGFFLIRHYRGKRVGRAEDTHSSGS